MENEDLKKDLESSRNFDNHDSEKKNSEPVIKKEKKAKVYWFESTEKAVEDYLFLHEKFYESKIEEEIEDAEKKKRKVNQEFCMEMLDKKNALLENHHREAQREKIFREHLDAPLRKLVENILFSFKLFTPGIDIKTQEDDCYTFLYSKFYKFNPWQNNKAFSYYGTVAKHYYLSNRKDSNKSTRILHNYEAHKEEVDSFSIEENGYFLKEKKDKIQTLFDKVVKSIEKDLENNNLSKNDQKVGDAIVQIFKKHELIGVYEKTDLHQLIQEYTKLKSKEITYSLHRFRVTYKVLKKGLTNNSD